MICWCSFNDVSHFDENHQSYIMAIICIEIFIAKLTAVAPDPNCFLDEYLSQKHSRLRTKYCESKKPHFVNNSIILSRDAKKMPKHGRTIRFDCLYCELGNFSIKNRRHCWNQRNYMTGVTNLLRFGFRIFFFSFLVLRLFVILRFRVEKKTRNIYEAEA